MSAMSKSVYPASGAMTALRLRFHFGVTSAGFMLTSRQQPYEKTGRDERTAADELGFHGKGM